MTTKSTTPPNNTPIVSASMYPTTAMALWMTNISRATEGGQLVTSVNGETGAVVITTADIDEAAPNFWLTAAEREKLAGIEAGAEVNDVTSVNGLTGAVVIDIPVTSVNGQTGDVDLRTVIDGGTATGRSPDYGYVVDGGSATTEYLPMIANAGGQDANDY